MTIRAILSFDPTATSMEATTNGNFAISFRVMEDSPLEYESEALAGQHVIAFYALLGNQTVNTITGADLKAAGAVESFDPLVARSLHEPFLPAALDDRHEAQLDLPRRDPGSVAGLHFA